MKDELESALRLAKEMSEAILHILKERDFDFQAIVEKAGKEEVLLGEMSDLQKATWTYLHRSQAELDLLKKEIRQYSPFMKSDLLPRVFELEVICPAVRDLFWAEMEDSFRVDAGEELAIREGFMVVMCKRGKKKVDAVIVIGGKGTPLTSDN